MKQLISADFQEIRQWVHQNARTVDLAVWQYHFEGGPAEAILYELAFYQNADGGFGRALEPDNWNPASSPYATLYAANMLRSAGLLGEPSPCSRTSSAILIPAPTP